HSSIIWNGWPDLPPDSITSAIPNPARRASLCTTATLRCDEENSSAKMFITNPARGCIDVLQFHPARRLRPFLDGSLRRGIPKITKPALGPLDDRNAIRVEIFFKAGARDLLPGLEPIQIKVEQSQPTAL